jgi:hypothetical protein
MPCWRLLRWTSDYCIIINGGITEFRENLKQLLQRGEMLARIWADYAANRGAELGRIIFGE